MTGQSALGDALADWCVQRQIPLHGCADVQGTFPSPWGGFPRAISLASPIPAEVLAPVREGPTSAYYAAYGEANTHLNRAADALAEWLRGRGYEALAYPATVAAGGLADLGDELHAPVQHKTVATRAGLGWIGRNALLITPQYGPRVRLATVFTNAPLSVAASIMDSRCGACYRCVEACPAEALRGETWHAGMAREQLVDVTACYATAKRLLLVRAGTDDAVCGVCIAVCPFARVPSP